MTNVTPCGGVRAALSHNAPWLQSLPLIHLEFGNEAVYAGPIIIKKEDAIRVDQTTQAYAPKEDSRALLKIWFNPEIRSAIAEADRQIKEGFQSRISLLEAIIYLKIRLSTRARHSNAYP